MKWKYNNRLAKFNSDSISTEHVGTVSVDTELYFTKCNDLFSDF